ncbi:RNA polymerase sigma factor [Nocardiopsis ansamitocini]|nr:sigma-70 family RNA polymerase sigma factor [Nocardiopsis ansamitocini]
MTDRELARALRSNGFTAAHACGLLFDAYGVTLYQHCVRTLGDRAVAQSVVRDTVIVARAHIGRLTAPDRLKEWLLALADAECARHTAVAEATRETAPGPEPETTGQHAALRVRVLSGVVAPELADYRKHVAHRADHLDRAGFPVPMGTGSEPGAGAYLIPGLFITGCAVAVLALVLVWASGSAPAPGW